jgi:hypothetical protein
MGLEESVGNVGAVLDKLHSGYLRVAASVYPARGYWIVNIADEMAAPAGAARADSS